LKIVSCFGTPHCEDRLVANLVRMVTRVRSRLPLAFDAHCHLHDARLKSISHEVIQRAICGNITHLVSCACYEKDWSLLEHFVSTIAERSLKIIPSFGVHPWWASDASPNYLSILRDKLEQHPHAAVRLGHLHQDSISCINTIAWCMM
jgi:Tat protein secretion system quality control protein TatD with DNase activity